MEAGIGLAGSAVFIADGRSRAGGNRQQKTPSGGDGGKERVKGVEPDRNASNSTRNGQAIAAGAAKGAVDQCPPMPADPDFRAVADAWPTLPAAIRAGILAMVKAANG